jgi:hypothetical protein
MGFNLALKGLKQKRHNNVHLWPERPYPRVVRDFTLKRLCMLRNLSSTAGIGPRATKRAPFLYCPLAFIHMNMEQQRRSEHGSAIDISMWRRNTFVHTHTEYSRGSKSIYSRLRGRTHVEEVRALVLNDAVTNESIDCLLLPQPQQLKHDVRLPYIWDLGKRGPGSAPQ